MKRQHNTKQFRKGKQSIFRIAQAGRINFLLDFITAMIFSISSYPSYIVEVFLRKKFGERYFTTANAILISIIMIFVWIKAGNRGQEFLGFTWLPFMALFLWKSIKHRLEIKKFGTTYDFDRFSYSDGEILPFWWRLTGTEILGVKITSYSIHVLLEPALPILCGLILLLLPFTRGIGFLILISGFLFGFRNFMKAHMARGHILDAIDKLLVEKWKYDALVEEKPKSETKGLSLPIDLPKSREMREELVNSLDVWDDELEEPELNLT